MPYTDQSIARRLLDNDPDALGQVMRWVSAALTSPRFWSLREEWPDLLQDVMARVLEGLQLGRFDDSRDLRVYVQGIARIASLEALRRRKRWVAPSEEVDRPAEDTDPESLAIHLELARRVLDLASHECRDLIRLYFYDAKNYEEIAAMLEVPSGTVKSRLFRCLESVREMLFQHQEPRPGRSSG
ncbi:MAG: RNA polymerase sigma factor [Candidatus Polarisedimenticolia bacterium]